VSLTRKIVHQAEGVLQEIQHLPRHRQARLKRFREILETITGRVRQVVRQTKARVFPGITQYPHKIVSLFEPHTEIIRKGKASKPNEFGNLVKVQEAENQIVTHYEVFAERPEDSRLLAENALVQVWAALADWLRRPDQRVEASSWIESLWLPRLCRYAAMGWPWSDRGQHRPDGPLSGCATGLKLWSPW
jgi:hypothetical protein